MRKQLALSGFLAVVLLACKLGGSAPAGSCDRRSVEDWESCFDYPKDEATAGKSSCAGANAGTWTDTGCEHASALGGCKMRTGITKWFFAGKRYATAEAAKVECSGDWVGPDGK